MQSNPDAMFNQPADSVRRFTETMAAALTEQACDNSGDKVEALGAVLTGIMLGAGEQVQYSEYANIVSTMLVGAVTQSGGAVLADVLLSFMAGMTNGINILSGAADTSD